MRISDWSSDVCSSDLNRFVADSGELQDGSRHRGPEAVARRHAGRAAAALDVLDLPDHSPTVGPGCRGSRRRLRPRFRRAAQAPRTGGPPPTADTGRGPDTQSTGDGNSVPVWLDTG